MIPKLVIITEIIAPYRIPGLNALGQRPELELEVVFLSENDPTLRQWKVYKEEIQFRYHVMPSWRFRLGKHNLLINHGVRSILNRILPDIVLCGGYNYPACWTAAYWSRSHKVPLLLWSESTAWDQRDGYQIVELLKARFLRLCAGFVVPGKSSFNYLEQLGIAPQRIFTAPNAVDTAMFSQAAEAARKHEPQVRARHQFPARYFLYVGRLVKDKGIFELLEAYAGLKPELRSQVGLVFAGNGPQQCELMERAKQIVPGTILFPGFVHREELPEIYALAAGLVFPTRSDPWGLVVNEAMACGLPVIATSVAGCALDLVQDGWNGFIVPPGDATELSHAMARMAEDSELQKKMSCRSRERIAAYSPAAWAQGILEAVQCVLWPTYPQGENW